MPPAPPRVAQCSGQAGTGAGPNRAWRHGRAVDARTFAERALAAADRSSGTMPGRRDQLAALFDLARFAADLADHRHATEWLATAVDLLRNLPQDPEREVWLSEALIQLGNEHRLAGHFTAARAALQEARERVDAAHLEPVRRAGACNALGILSKDTGDLVAADRWYTTALDLLGDAYNPDDPPFASLQHNLAGLARARADHLTAEAHARRALQLRASAHTRPVDLAGDLCVLGAALAGQGRHEKPRPP